MLDNKDLKILELLQNNSKLTSSVISKKTTLPITTVHNRVKKMEKIGVIKKYTLEVDNEKIGKPILAFIEISVNYELKDGTRIKQEDVALAIRKLNEVEEVHIVAGGTDILLKVRGKDVKNINSFIIDKLRNIKGVDKTQTMIVLSSY